MSTRPTFERGDVVYGADPFKLGEHGRPWLVVSNHEGRPFYGEQYIALTLTTSSWLDGLIPIGGDDWIAGGTPADSNVAPWSVQSISHGDIARWQGRLAPDLVDSAVDALIDELEGSSAPSGGD